MGKRKTAEKVAETAEEKSKKSPKAGAPSSWLSLANIVWNVLGVGIGIAFAKHHAWYQFIQHENEMWFSNIKEVEREISFRTESGLYYSYFKQTIQANGVVEAFHQFTHDNKTEFPNEVNILERFNIYQEIALGIFYLLFSNWIPYRPILFYTYSVFNLQMVYSFALYATTWILAGSWTAAVPTAVFFTFSRFDMTRVEFTVPLRESFALPFWAVQLCILTFYFKPSTRHHVGYTLALSLSSFCFAICWQFNQFVFLLQACALYGTGALDLVPVRKVKTAYAALGFALAMTYILQFFNEMTPRALVVSFIPAAWLMLCYRLKGAKDGALLSFVKLALEIVITIALAALFQLVIKQFFNVEPDEHIFKFLQAKFQIAQTDDFDAKLYLCNGAFNFMPWDTFPRLATQGLLPAWAAVLVLGLLLLFYHQIQVWSVDEKTGKPLTGPFTDCPELGYNLIHSFVFFLLALSTMRMKYLWTPHAAILAGLIALPKVWNSLRWKDGRLFASAALVALCLYGTYDDYKGRISKEMEFYDPDTVELMEWGAKLPQDTVFSGSMQLNAGVRLSTWRALTNHPHYEDKRLRVTTFDVMQMYARRTPEEVLTYLGKYGTTHILVENSICYMGGQKADNCATPDLLDLANGHLLADRTTPKPGLPNRFCDEIQRNQAYSKYFKKVLENRTFRVYQLQNNEKFDTKIAERKKLIDYYY